MNLRSLLPIMIRICTGAKLVCTTEPVEACRPRIYYANHSSNLDFLMIWATLPSSLRASVRPVAAADYWQSNRLRRFLADRVFRAILIERTRVTKGCCPLDPMLDSLRGGESLILFPEGTRDAGDTVSAFKSGLYHLAKHLPEIEFVPVWLENTFRILPKGEVLPLPLISTVQYGSPTFRLPEEDKQHFLARMRADLLALKHL